MKAALSLAIGSNLQKAPVGGLLGRVGASVGKPGHAFFGDALGAEGI